MTSLTLVPPTPAPWSYQTFFCRSINIIYTFSNILTSIYGNEINQTFKNKKFGEFNSNKTIIITVGNCEMDFTLLGTINHIGDINFGHY